ncbi:MAG: HD domain-containing protein [Proteobacteria bacterium]|nr:HD domain-containing protein [Pseudomonadota bacterium]
MVDNKNSSKKRNEINAIFLAIIENTYDAIFVFDVTPNKVCQISWWNKICVKETGINEKDAIGKTIYEIFPERLHDPLIQGLKKCLQEKKTDNFEINIRFINKEEYFNVTLIPLLNNKNEVYKIIGISHNLTDHILNVMGLKKLNSILEEIIGALATLEERRDPYTAGHQRRVCDLAKTIAETYGLDEHQIHWLRFASLVHDIGKNHVPSEILTKPTSLTPAEYEIIKEHVESGYKILKTISFPGPIADIVYQHHEFIDGSGYPRGLKENEICIEAKILTIADIVEAMSSHRPYRAGREINAALDQIRMWKGIKLDPKIVDACIQVFDEGYQFIEYSKPLSQIIIEESLSRE